MLCYNTYKQQYIAARLTNYQTHGSDLSFSFSGVGVGGIVTEAKSAVV